MAKETFAELTDRYCEAFNGVDFFWPDWLADSSSDMAMLEGLMVDAIKLGRPFESGDFPSPRKSDVYDGKKIY